MTEDRGGIERSKDGRSWRLGSGAEVRWIEEGSESGLRITSGIPPASITRNARSIVAAFCHAVDPEWQKASGSLVDR